MKKAFILLYLVVLLAEVIGLLSGKEEIHVWIKPLLMPLLMIIILQPNNPTKSPKPSLILLAIFLSWLGDVFLLWEAKHSLFFILGLLAFLLAHICYLVYFLKSGSRFSLNNSKTIMLTVGVFSYGTWLVVRLWPFLGSLSLPVVVYAATLSCMVIISLLLPKNLKTTARFLMGFGAILFLISDSLLAHHLFVKSAAWVGASVMATYGLAQLFIVMGALHVFAAKQYAKPAPVQ